MARNTKKSTEKDKNVSTIDYQDQAGDFYPYGDDPYGPLGTATLADVPDETEESDFQGEPVVSWLPGGIFAFNPETGVVALILPDSGKVGAFRPNDDNQAVLDNSDLQEISLLMAFLGALGSMSGDLDETDNTAV